MGHDWTALLWQQSSALADLADALDDADLDHVSLCEGWTARDVFGHMLVGHTTQMPKILALVVSYRGNIAKGSYEKSKELAAGLTPAEIRTRWRSVATEHTLKGISRLIPKRDGFLDHFVHEQDIRRPLGLPAPTDQARLQPALDAAVTVSSPIFAPAKRVKGLRLEATDLDWTHGDGPSVRGSAEALVMAAAGRTAAIADLEGDGVVNLTA
ncbi:MAG: maleylpyruvate isomerase family mycothiol-dependent enzyme [Acidimicrobiia bacterium]|nr:maleylpyruvate isomerase family mycothiol-dependent enzyme [Acidimicrobiia bacterium]